MLAGRSSRSRSPLAWLTIAMASAPTAVATAEPLETFVDADNEEDLYDLFVAEQINEETLSSLVELMRRGIDLNTADREDLYSLPNLTYAEVDAILTYRDEAGRIDDPASLVTNGILSQKRLAAVAAFLVVRVPARPAYATDGWLRFPLVWTIDDGRSPAMALQAHAATFRHLSLGVGSLVTRNRVSDVVFDPVRGALSARAPSTQVHVPKFYALWDEPDFALVFGTYRVGFGQRLTFDNTDQSTPNGIYADHTLFRDTQLKRRCSESAGELPDSPCAGAARYQYVTPDYRWREGLRGVAIGLKDLRAGPGKLELYGFASLATKSIYQYEIYVYDRDLCRDPRNDADPNCAAPWVFRRQDDPLAPTTRFSFQTLPDMYNERVLGGNASYWLNRRTHVGLTGYGSMIDWLVDGIHLDFQEWSSTPWGTSSFGAVGVDAGWGHDLADVYLEVARSFDATPDGGGGFGAILRGTGTWAKSEVEASLRHYDQDFANPYARPIAADDELDGLRARDETGGRLRYTALVQRTWQLRALVDVWVQSSVQTPKARLYLRADHDVTPQWAWGVWTELYDKDLSQSGRMQCFSVSLEEDENGEPVPCSGQKLQLAGRLRYQPRRDLSLSLQYQHRWVDDASAEFASSYRQDLSAWLAASAKVSDEVRVRARFRYLSEAISDATYGEESLWAYVDATYRLPRDLRLRARYDLISWLDERASSLVRSPNPEHWLWLEVEQKF